ncbi:hypothetical protein F5Y05DRAFT_284128 [Hypoxylon sp. FL0543]|nr:hypothetical protein F5Y05DRAFT_284128 [Hypoxylon sp. FL0543]
MATEKATLVAYEKPALSPGDYVAHASQTLAVGTETTQPWETIQHFSVDQTPPYALPPGVLHSFYPPRLQTVPAETLPHVILNGAVTWERQSAQSPPAAGEAPLPWLGLLVFTEEELVAPPEFASYKQDASAAVQLPLSTVAGAFPGRHPLPENPGAELAQFIFLKQSTFKAYFMRQETPAPGPDGKPAETKPQDHPDLTRYKYLVHVNKTEGPSSAKVSVILAHKVRPPVDGAAAIKVYAHLVSLERVDQINYPADEKPDDVFPLVSLHSWVFEWGAIPTKPEESGKDMFSALKERVRPLVLDLETPVIAAAAPEVELTAQEKQTATEKDAASKWMRSRMEDGHTIVRHRPVTGNVSMAIYRGPLVPQPLSTRPAIHPSMYGTDLQILDAHTQILDVSYSIAWDLGRSLAAKSPRFSVALAELRRNIVLKATSRAENAPIVAPDVEQVTVDVVKQLETLFGPGGFDGLKSAPAEGKPRWQPATGTNPPPLTPATMTAAKLIRNLKDVGKTWLESAAEALAKAAPGTQDGTVGGLQDVISWIEKHIFTMIFIPALTMFPEPAALKPEFISTFYIDDAWIDAVVDGALSVGNAMGGTHDAVRDVIRHAINKYISARPEANLQIARQGFILRSAFVEAFPDLSLTISQGTIVHQVRREDMMLCFFDPGPDLAGKTVDVTISQPPHQQRFGVTKVAPGQLTLTFDVSAFRQTQPGVEPQPAIGEKTWEKDKPSTIPTVAEPIIDWTTGILFPSTLSKASKAVAQEILQGEFQELSSDSESLYLAVHLQDRPSSLIIPFSVPPGRSSTTRRLFPDQDGDETPGPATLDPRGTAVTHTDPEGRSYLSKTVYALSFPGKNIPARSGPLIDLIFKVKGTERATDRVLFTSLSFEIPIGECAEDLLAPETPTPSAKMVGLGHAWICTSYKASDAKLNVELRPRGAGVAGGPGLDASFQLIGCRINGVPGRNAVIRSMEKFRDEAGEHEVTDAWAVAKE